jgi:hypothetical protein
MRCLVMLSVFLFIGCFDKKGPEVRYTLWIKNAGGNKELVARFYQIASRGDCDAVRTLWLETYPDAWCEAN